MQMDLEAKMNLETTDFEKELAVISEIVELALTTRDRYVSVFIRDGEISISVYPPASTGEEETTACEG